MVLWLDKKTLIPYAIEEQLAFKRKMQLKKLTDIESFSGDFSSDLVPKYLLKQPRPFLKE